MIDPDFELTKVEPHYDYSRVGGGHFKLHFGVDKEMSYTLSFVGFLEFRLKDDEQLFEYIKAHHQDKTVSHAVWDLYDLGYPVDQWVKDYVEMAKKDVDPKMFNALLAFYRYVRDFGEPSSSFDAD